VTTRKMHTDEVDTDAALVRRLLASQFPQWADLPLRPVSSAGTDNAIYRLGDTMSVRLPRIHWAVGQVAKEHEWLPKLAPHLPVTLPVQLAIGAPGEGYPYPWAVYEWLAGENATLGQLADPEEAAHDLAYFILALQRIDTTDGPRAAEHNLRGVPLHTRDTATRQALAELHGMFDAGHAIAVWEEALRAPEWDRAPVWFHGDLLPGNLLFQAGRLHAVIDWSGLGVGDPAPDLMSAWSLFTGESRAAFRHALGVDDATWSRARGHALSQAVIFIPYYLATNPVGVANARRAVEQILAEDGQRPATPGG
jgi:aminoglycoside phosphotransferase (APT) family kinase protein